MKSKIEFLQKHVFGGLKNLNDGFDSEAIYYFSAADFEIVLNRAEQLGIEIMGIEPWHNGTYFDVLTEENFQKEASNQQWYRKAFSELQLRRSDLMYSASYRIPDSLINE